jgi:hypothetical protein
MRRLSTLTILMAALVFLCVSLIPEDSNAIPTFARKHQMTCSNCHLAWPQLNQLGRTFKEDGYRFPGNEKTEVISDFLQWDKHIPLTAVIVSRPYDEQKSDVRKVRALHEVELMVAGLLYKNVSGFLEIEAEDEEDFEPEINTGVLGYHPMKALNIQLSYSPVLWADPYDTFSEKRRLTRGAIPLLTIHLAELITKEHSAILARQLHYTEGHLKYYSIVLVSVVLQMMPKERMQIIFMGGLQWI